MSFRGPAAVVVLLLASAALTSALGQTPTAIVEDIDGHPAGLQLMDYVDVGRVIELGPNDSIVLSYLSSCVREAIRGGSVKVGAQQSDKVTGTIERTKVDCEAAQMLQANGQSNDSASLIVRGTNAPSLRLAPAPEFRIYGSSPIFELDGEGTLVVARLDTKGEYFTMKVASKQLLHGAFLDFAAEGKTLTPGGVYGARWAGRLIAFKVDENAKPDRSPVVGRLLRLETRN